jgi:hypothetical protein
LNSSISAIRERISGVILRLSIFTHPYIYPKIPKNEQLPIFIPKTAGVGNLIPNYYDYMGLYSQNIIIIWDLADVCPFKSAPATPTFLRFSLAFHFYFPNILVIFAKIISYDISSLTSQPPYFIPAVLSDSPKYRYLIPLI